MMLFEDLPDELILMIFSYLNPSDLLEKFLHLNSRLKCFIGEYFPHVDLLKSFDQENSIKIFDKYFPLINEFVRSLTIDHQIIGREFLHRTKSIRFDFLKSLRLIDESIDLFDEFVQRFPLEFLRLSSTSFYETTKSICLRSTSIKRIQIDLQIEHFIDNSLLNHLDLHLTSILVDLRLSFSKLSIYFQMFSSKIDLPIEKFSLTIFSIDSIDQTRKFVFPKLKDFQLEICSIEFDLLKEILPLTNEEKLQRFSFTGKTTKIDSQSWKILLQQYRSIERIDLKIFQSNPNLFEWENQFDKYFFHFDRRKNLFQISSSKFDHLDRICLNESVDDLEQIDYPTNISHLTIRSQYWCSKFDLSSTIFIDLLQRFVSLRRLSINYQQLKMFLQKNFLLNIEQLDLEFSERYCFIDQSIAEEFQRLKSLQISSIYQGSYPIELHSTIKTILFQRFSQLNFLSIDSIEIIDDQEENIDKTIIDWFSHRSVSPRISYLKGKSFSIWF